MPRRYIQQMICALRSELKYLIAIIASLVHFGAPSISAQTNSRLVIVLETIKKEVPVEATLYLNQLTAVRNDGGTESFDIDRTWYSGDFADRAMIVFESPLTPGKYSGLILRLDSAHAQIGPAIVTPNLSDSGVTINYPFFLESEDGVVLHLSWQPHEVQPKEPYYAPSLKLDEMVVPPVGAQVFVSCEESNHLAIVDRDRSNLVDIIPTGAAPKGLAVSTAGLLYAACYGSDEIFVIDYLTRQLSARIKLRFNDGPERLALSEDEDELYIVCTESGQLVTMATSSLQEINRITLGNRPHALAIDPATGQVFVSFEDVNEIAVYDPRSETIVRTLTVESSPTEMTFGRDAQEFWLARRRLPIVNQVDPIGGAVSTRVSLCAAATGLVYAPRQGRIFAAITDCNELAILQSGTDVVVGTIVLPGKPGLQTLDPEERELLGAMQSPDGLTLVNVNSRSLKGIVDVGRKPYMAIVPN
jgi:hypothetical protein